MKRLFLSILLILIFTIVMVSASETPKKGYTPELDENCRWINLVDISPSDRVSGHTSSLLEPGKYRLNISEGKCPRIWCSPFNVSFIIFDGPKYSGSVIEYGNCNYFEGCKSYETIFEITKPGGFVRVVGDKENAVNIVLDKYVCYSPDQKESVTPTPTFTGTERPKEKETPGFELLAGLVALISALYLIRGWRR